MTLRPLDLLMATVFFVALVLLITTGPSDVTIADISVPDGTACGRGEVIAINHHTDTAECVHLGLLD